MLFRRNEPESAEGNTELKAIRRTLQQTHLPEIAAQVAQKELDKLERTDPSLAEYTIGLNYLELLLALPWERSTLDTLDLKHVEAVLAQQHYGLAPVKERIVDYLAGRMLCSLQPARILVVDDEEIARTNLEYILRKDGYQVGAAASAMAALEHLSRGEYDIVLTDLKMEQMDGMQLLELIKQRAPHTEVVMITGYATVSSAVTALRKGAAQYLSKPIDLEELRRTVRELAEKKRLFQVNQGPVLCFSGPPGTGKTSIGQAIATALGRKFVRFSLAGMRDEAELRGHRRTYAGALPGRIISEIRRLGFNNPVFMLDEIDKLGQDFRGDPAAVLLEVLDPEQNREFVDHYLEIPFDLSRVMFIATANLVESLPGPLLDRLEVISFPGYTLREKQEIARRYLWPRQLRSHGLAHLEIDLRPEAGALLIQHYTQEAGLRQLNRTLATIARKLARLCLQNPAATQIPPVDRELVHQFLGPWQYQQEIAARQDRVGVATGLVWTAFGGQIIFVEAVRMKGHQQLLLTGSLGEVLRESAQTALSFVRSQASTLHLAPDFFADSDIHIHIPAGAIPKDGPSAGVTIAVSLISLLTGRPVRRDVALSGELTLNGQLLPVSGIREKLLAAQRAGVRMVILPRRNQADLEAVEPESREGMEVVLADNILDVLDLVLQPQ